MVSQILKLKIGILNPRETQIHTLNKFATFIKRVRASELSKSQFPDQLKDARGTFEKPSDW
jgi:hypothetical protein